MVMDIGKIGLPHTAVLVEIATGCIDGPITCGSFTSFPQGELIGKILAKRIASSFKSHPCMRPEIFSSTLVESDTRGWDVDLQFWMILNVPGSWIIR